MKSLSALFVSLICVQTFALSEEVKFANYRELLQSSNKEGIYNYSEICTYNSLSWDKEANNYVRSISSSATTGTFIVKLSANPNVFSTLELMTASDGGKSMFESTIVLSDDNTFKSTTRSVDNDGSNKPSESILEVEGKYINGKRVITKRIKDGVEVPNPVTTSSNVWGNAEQTEGTYFYSNENLNAEAQMNDPSKKLVRLRSDSVCDYKQSQLNSGKSSPSVPTAPTIP